MIFGEASDEPLLGATTLGSFGLVLDPFKRRLIRCGWWRDAFLVSSSGLRGRLSHSPLGLHHIYFAAFTTKWQSDCSLLRIRRCLT